MQTASNFEFLIFEYVFFYDSRPSIPFRMYVLRSYDQLCSASQFFCIFGWKTKSLKNHKFYSFFLFHYNFKQLHRIKVVRERGLAQTFPTLPSCTQNFIQKNLRNIYLFIWEIFSTWEGEQNFPPSCTSFHCTNQKHSIYTASNYGNSRILCSAFRIENLVLISFVFLATQER